MGVNERTHPGQLLAHERRATASTDGPTCGSCGGQMAEDGDERVEHVLPAGGNESCVEQYCSPSCFVRQMERIGGIE